MSVVKEASRGGAATRQVGHHAKGGSVIGSVVKLR